MASARRVRKIALRGTSTWHRVTAILRTPSASRAIIRRCHDIGAQKSKAAYSFSRLCWLTDPARFLSNISNTCGRFIVRSRRACHSKRTLSVSCRTISMPFGHCRTTMPILPHTGARSKADFPAELPAAQLRSRSKMRRRETGIWQRRFWEHAIRDDTDFERHVDYIHFNPVKHGYVTRVCDWPYSSFHRYVPDGLLRPMGSHLAAIAGPSASNRSEGPTACAKSP